MEIFIIDDDLNSKEWNCIKDDKSIDPTCNLLTAEPKW